MMKKSTKLLSVLLALCMVASLLPGMALAASKTVGTASELTNAIDQAAAGDTIKLTGNFSLTAQLPISKSITIDGGGYALTYSGDKAAILVKPAENDTAALKVTLSSIKLTGAAYGVELDNAALTLSGKVDFSGNTTAGVSIKNESTLVLTNATLQNTTEVINKPTLITDGPTDSAATPAPLSTITESKSQPLYQVNNEYYLAGDAKLTHTTPASGSIAAKTTIVGYRDLDVALSKAADGDTITLQRDAASSREVDDDITLDLGGHNLTSNITVNKAALVLKNGTIESATTAISLTEATLDLQSNVTVKGTSKGTSKGSSSALISVGASSTATISGTVTAAGGTCISGLSKNGSGTTININSSAVITADKDVSGTIALSHPQSGTLNIYGGAFTGETALSIAGGTVSITKGSFTGETALKVTGGNISVADGTFIGSAKSLDIASAATVSFTTGCFGGAIENASSFRFTAGYFSENPTGQLADGKIAGSSTKADYPFTVKTLAIKNYVISNVGDTKVESIPSSTSSSMGSTARTTLTNYAKTVSLPDGNEPLIAAAGDIVSALTSSDITKATAALKTAGVDVTNKTVKIVIVPKLQVTPVYYNTSTRVITFDISPVYDKYATVSAVSAATASSGMTLTGDIDSVKLNSSALDLSVADGVNVAVKFEISSALAGTAKDGVYPDMQVKNTKSDGTIHYYTAKIAAIAASGTKYYASFTLNHGFSEFSLQPADSRKLTIKFDKDSSGKAVTTTLSYTAADIGNALPTFTGCDGWKFTTTADADITGVKDTYTKLTGAVWDTLMKNVAAGGSITIKATAVLAKDTAFDVTIKGSTNGTVTANVTKDIKKGTTVTLTVVPASDYKLGSLIISGASGYALNYTTVTANSKYTFAMPEEDVTVTATFTTTFPFTDVIKSDWYYDEVKYAYDHGLVSGLDADTFAPENNTTRGMVVTLLHRLSGKPGIANENTFTDVPNGMYYTTPIIWANYNEIVTGYGNGKFAPDEYITREQMATILYKYAKFRGVSVTATADLSKYPDSSKIQSYATQAMSWAVAKGLINGIGGSLVPQGTATRAQVAAILARFDQNII